MTHYHDKGASFDNQTNMGAAALPCIFYYSNDDNKVVYIDTFRCYEFFNENFVANLLPECASERILKIGQYLMKYEAYFLDHSV